MPITAQGNGRTILLSKVENIGKSKVVLMDCFFPVVRMILFDEKSTPACRAVAYEHGVDVWKIRDAYNRANKWPDDPTREG